MAREQLTRFRVAPGGKHLQSERVVPCRQNRFRPHARPRRRRAAAPRSSGPIGPTSREMSKDLKRRGFRFVGPTVCYAFMQATGMVNAHVADCFRWAEINDMRRGPTP